jgi:hypothetical protein
VATDPQELHSFRLAEYSTLADLVTSRDERVDRFITVYLTLAGAPFALFAVILKQGANGATTYPPALIAWLWLFCGLFGIYLVQVIVQLRFSTILYVRAMNGIRSIYGGEKPAELGLWLPANTKYPAYDEGDHVYGDKKHPAKYMFHIIEAMSILNGIYVGLGMYFIPGVVVVPLWLRILGPLATGIFVWRAQIHTYRASAKHREARASGTGLI